MQIVAERVTETGVFFRGEWLNFSKFGKRPEINEGGAYDVVTKDFRGRKYIQSADALPGLVGTPPAAAKPTTTASTGGVVADFNMREDNKSKRILIQGVYQACLHSPGLVGFTANADEYLAQVEAATKRGVSFINSLVD